MSVVDRFKNLFIKRSITNSSNVQFRRNFDYKMLAAYAQAYDIEFNDFNFTDAVNRVSVVYQAIDILSNTIARIPTSITTDINNDGDYEEFKTHFWYNNIKYKPNSLQSDFEFRRQIATSIYTKGNAYVYKNILRGELEIIHPDLIDDIRIEDGIIKYYSKQLGYVFLQNEIIHYKKFSTGNSLKGLSPIEALRTNMNILHLAEKTTEEYYRHGGRSPLVIEREADRSIDPNTLTEGITELQAKNLNGRFSIREPLVLPPSLKAKELKLSQEDLMFASVCQYTNEQIANLFGIPSYLIYASKGVAGKFEQENLAFKNTTIGNYLEMFRSTSVDSLISLEDRSELNANISYDIDKLNDLDFSSLATQAVQLSNNGIITKNEARKMIGKNKYSDPNADKLLTQSQYVSISDRDLSNTSTQAAA